MDDTEHSSEDVSDGDLASRLTAVGNEESDQTAIRAGSLEERQELLQRCISSLEELAYAEVDSSSQAESPAEMVRVHVVAHGAQPASVVQADIRSAWKTTVARGKPALNVVRETEGGFDFRFAVLDHGVFLCGVYSVEIPHRDQ